MSKETTSTQSFDEIHSQARASFGCMHGRNPQFFEVLVASITMYSVLTELKWITA